MGVGEKYALRKVQMGYASLVEYEAYWQYWLMARNDRWWSRMLSIGTSATNTLASARGHRSALSF